MRDKGIRGRSGGVRCRGWRTADLAAPGSHLMDMVECAVSGETEGWDFWEEMEDVTN